MPAGPDRAVQRRPTGVGRHIDRLDAGGERRHRQQEKGDRHKPGKGVMRTTESGKSPASDLRFPS